MKFCIAAVLLIACVAPAVFAADLPGATAFSAASQDVMKSPKAPPQVKQIFQRFLAAVAASKPCVTRADLQCILNVFKNVGVRGMQEGIATSSGPWKQMFQRLLPIDQQAVSELTALPASGGKKAVDIANKTLLRKASVIKQGLAQLSPM